MVITGDSTNKDDVIVASDGNDVINSGNGNDTIDGGAGNDTLRGGAGDDTLIYILSDNLTEDGTSDLYVGGSGVDTVRLVLTEEQFHSDNVQTQIAAYQAQLANVKLNQQGEVSNGSASDFTFTFVSEDGKTAMLTVSMMEKLAVVALPEAHNVGVSGLEDTTIIVELSGTDADGDIQSFILTSLPANGILYVDGELYEQAAVGTAYTSPIFYFVPYENFAGDVSFEYTVTDNLGASDLSPATATIHVTEVTDAPTIEGTAIDGYIVGATVFADANENGILDPGEASATTGSNGQFSLVGGNGSLVLTGGTDISTGLPFEGQLTAPAGSEVVTPLTTLIQALVVTGYSAAAAETQVELALGLSDENVDLTTFDPVEAALDPNPTIAEIGLSVYSSGVQIQNTIIMAAALVDGADGATSFEEAAEAVVGALAAQIDSTGTLNLSSETTVSDLIDAADTNNILSTTDLQSAGAILSDSNALVDAAADLTDVAQIAVVSQEDIAGALSDGTASATDVTTYDETTIDDLANAATIGAVGGTVVGDASNNSLTGSSGPDAIDGLAGNDTIFGGLGNDYLFGGTGNDRLFGEDGDDQLFGDANNDRLIGGAGDDLLDGGENLTTALGDTDAVDYSSEVGAYAVTVNLATGTATDTFGNSDTLRNIERVIGSSLADNLTAGDVTILRTNLSEHLEGLAGNDVITGGSIAAGFTTWSRYDTSPSGIVVNLTSAPIDLDPGAGIDDIAAGTARDGYGTVDTLSNINRIRGSAYADLIHGGTPVSGNERFEGMAGADTIHGGGGIDYLHYQISPGAVTVNLGFDGSGVVANDGFGASDTFTGIEGVRGSAFNDSLTGSDRTDQVERYEGMAGNDTITGNGGIDQVEYGQSPTSVIVNLGDVAVTVGAVTVDPDRASDGFGYIDALSGIEWAGGSRLNDTLIGGSEANRFDGGAGDDTMYGNAGDDTLIGSEGADLLDGGTTPGVIPGNAGDSDLADYQYAGSGVRVNLAPAPYAGYGGIAAQTGFVTGDAGDTDTLVNFEWVSGSNHGDVLVGGSNDNFERFQGRGGDDTIDGGSGFDEAYYEDATSGVAVDLGAGTGSGGGVGSDTLISVEAVRGSLFADTLTGDANNNRFRPQQGADTVDGGAGFDEVDYRSTIGGGVIVNLSSAPYTGDVGAGDQTVDPGRAIDGYGGVGSTDVLILIENIRGSNQNDILVGSSDANRLRGENGDDLLLGNAANDTLEGGNGNDTLRGGAGNDTLLGGAGDDNLWGGPGDDRIDGGDGIDMLNGSLVPVAQNFDLSAGSSGFDMLVSIENVIGSAFNDTITGDGNDNLLAGSEGNDILVGGGGADTFDWNAGDEGTAATPAVDTISDFDPTLASGTDALNLKDILVGETPGTLGNYLGFGYDGANTTIDVISTGMGLADQKIVLTGVNLTAIGDESTIISDLLASGKLIAG